MRKYLVCMILVLMSCVACSNNEVEETASAVSETVETTEVTTAVVETEESESNNVESKFCKGNPQQYFTAKDYIEGFASDFVADAVDEDRYDAYVFTPEEYLDLYNCAVRFAKTKYDIVEQESDNLESVLQYAHPTTRLDLDDTVEVVVPEVLYYFGDIAGEPEIHCGFLFNFTNSLSSDIAVAYDIMQDKMIWRVPYLKGSSVEGAFDVNPLIVDFYDNYFRNYTQLLRISTGAQFTGIDDMRAVVSNVDPSEFTVPDVLALYSKAYALGNQCYSELVASSRVYFVLNAYGDYASNSPLYELWYFIDNPSSTDKAAWDAEFEVFCGFASGFQSCRMYPSSIDDSNCVVQRVFYEGMNKADDTLSSFSELGDDEWTEIMDLLNQEGEENGLQE